MSARCRGRLIQTDKLIVQQLLKAEDLSFELPLWLCGSFRRKTYWIRSIAKVAAEGELGLLQEEYVGGLSLTAGLGSRTRYSSLKLFEKKEKFINKDGK